MDWKNHGWNVLEKIGLESIGLDGKRQILEWKGLNCSYKYITRLRLKVFSLIRFWI